MVIRDVAGQLRYEAAFFLGRQTNNAAEYHALIRALDRARQLSPAAITVHSDSELLVRQLTGEYQVKSPRLAGLHEQAQLRLLRMPRWSVRHVRREQNTRADELANLAMDRRQDVIVFDADGPVVPGKTELPPHTAEPAPAEVGSAAGSARPAVRVTVAQAPGAGGCPAGPFPATACTIRATLPAGLCVHAAHALLPTVLAMLNTTAEEFASVPTLTVRCGRPGCDAVFELSPAPGANGEAGGG